MNAAQFSLAEIQGEYNQVNYKTMPTDLHRLVYDKFMMGDIN